MISIIMADDVQPNHNFVNYFESAKDSLRHILTCRGFKSNEIEQNIMLFNKYIDSETNAFDNFKTEVNCYSWTQISYAYPELEILSDIALRLLSSATGEASCERTIKRRRLIQTSCRLNSNKELLDARMILTSI